MYANKFDNLIYLSYISRDMKFLHIKKLVLSVQ